MSKLKDLDKGKKSNDVFHRQPVRGILKKPGVAVDPTKDSENPFNVSANQEQASEGDQIRASSFMEQSHRSTSAPIDVEEVAWSSKPTGNDPISTTSSLFGPTTLRLALLEIQIVKRLLFNPWILVRNQVRMLFASIGAKITNKNDMSVLMCFLWWLNNREGISLIATYIGKPIMLDSFTSSMCKESWGRSSFARVLIEIASDSDFKENIIDVEAYSKGYTKAKQAIPRGVSMSQGFSCCKEIRLNPKATVLDTNGGKFRDVVANGWNLNINGCAMFRLVKRLKGLKSPLRKLLYDQVSWCCGLVTSVTPLDNHDLFSRVLDVQKAAHMVRNVSDAEIKSALFSMSDDKAPGPDGFTAAFFKKAWDIVGDNFSCAIRDFFSNGKLLREVNHTIIALIPKVTTPCDLGDLDESLICVGYGSHDSVSVIMDTLEEFMNVSGLVPSIPKSTAFFCNVPIALKSSTLNLMPFAEDAGLLDPALSSMNIYWAAVFISSVRIISDLEQLMRGFLWCQGEMKKGKAEVAWDSVCLPLKEGGLGIRRLEEFNTALMVSHIWSILNARDSLWVQWIYDYKFQGRSFWDVLVWGYVSLRRAKLFQIESRGLLLSDNVRGLISNGIWRWPSDWYDRFPDIVSIHVPPICESRDDCLVWRDNDGVNHPFSVAHSIHLWLVIRKKLKTQDRLKQWDVGICMVENSVSLCGRDFYDCSAIDDLSCVSLFPSQIKALAGGSDRL
ncbi:hypothetical protein Tco_0312815 [Tanacetum coccineum]